MFLLITNSKAGVFSKLKDIWLFNKVHLQYGVATWPEEIDIAPDTIVSRNLVIIENVY